MNGHVRKSAPPVPPVPPTLCSPELVADCMARMDRMEQRFERGLREVHEALGEVVRSSERKNVALESIERMLRLGNASQLPPGVAVKRTGENPAIPEGK